MTTPTEYVLQLKAKLAISPIVASFNVVEEKVWSDRGYIRLRIALSNGDFLEAAGVFRVAGQRLHHAPLSLSVDE
jgi:hypothetical protein